MKMVNLRRPPVGVNLQGSSFIGGMADVNDHVARVAAGGGTGANESDLFKIYRFLHSHGLLSGTKLLWTPEAGYVQRVDGVLNYCRTGFDTSLFDNDLDGSATASQQPRLVGGIAPNSKPAASNQTGESRKFTHATITVTGTYTVVKMLNTTGKYVNTYTEVVGGTITECTWTGGMRLYMVYAGVLSAGQRAIIDAFVLTLYHEIESVVIGTQTWASRNFEAVATPLGNVIANVTDNAAWANATVLYDAAYAAHVGDAAAKEYAGLKAAAMWCYYNNSADNGAIYGKLYNWYAAKLLDLDMVTAGFGWRVPTSAQFTTLATYLGGTSVAGGKMKMIGTDYWNTPNTGATNESGFTALGGGMRLDNGIFNDLKKSSFFFSDVNIRNDFRVYLSTNNSSFTQTAAGIGLRGFSLRLIKE